ncbi:NACHT domain-containing protein [Actinoplanes sp. NPDC048796]|uniref:NACHT domain-containing protein n=1 Tax=Actinoplanes sp. NPDC048796 TaxID=3155640 RepID=UPI0033CA4F66
MEILGRAGTPGVDKLDAALGGLILAAGVGAGVAAVGGAALAPAGLLAALWGWVDQKNEAIALLRRAVGRLAPTIEGVSDPARRTELIDAAHTTIAAAAFFEEVQRRRIAAGLTDEDRRALLTGSRASERDQLIDCLYLRKLDAPDASAGFVENLDVVRDWMLDLGKRTQRFLAGLDGFRMFDVYVLADDAVRRYQSYYEDLAVAVPEMAIRIDLSEHAATRHRIDVLAGLIERERPLDPAVGLVRANRARLRERVVPGGVDRESTPITFPLIDDLFIEPRYRGCQVAEDTRIGDETWWAGQPLRTDLLATLGTRAGSREGAELPMLVLGHPGAGKSMLTKILAARLAETDFVVVWVPLRAVSAHAPVLNQIEEGLRLATNTEIAWAELAGRAGGKRRVVILDGLDELLQASPSDRSGYLQEVAAFQRLERDQERPVSVVVTSRTVVAERVDTPRTLFVVKLEEFEQEQTREWLRRWNTSNALGIAAGDVRRLTLGVVLRQPHLASQPLLLLLLAIYAADPATPALDAGMSITALYERLITTFVRREAEKKKSAEAHDATTAAIDRLCVAALAMFNRGRQHVSEAELGDDLTALAGVNRAAERPEVTGRRLLAEFFFVHAAEAVGLHRTERVYEFLHATFGEYLIARKVVEELRDIADKASGGWREREPDDGQLRTLLSHQALATRRPIEQFTTEMLGGLGERERRGIAAALTALIRQFRQGARPPRSAGYWPSGIDHLRELSAYSANLFLLRMACEPADGTLRLADLLPEPVMTHWREAVMLWRCGLGAEGWHAMLGFFRLSETDTAVIGRGTGPQSWITPIAEMSYYELIGDDGTLQNYAIGATVNRQVGWEAPDWYTRMRLWLVAEAAGCGPMWFVSMPPPGTATEQLDEIRGLISRVVARFPADGRADEDFVAIVRILTDDPKYRPTVAAAVCRIPALLEATEDLRAPRLYEGIPMAAMMDAVRLEEPSEAWRELRAALPDAGPQDLAQALRLLLDVPATSPGVPARAG